MKVGIVGLGKVGSALSYALSQTEKVDLHLFSRNEAKLQSQCQVLKAKGLNEKLAKTMDILILCVTDTALKDVAAQWHKLAPEPIIAHTSGSQDLLRHISDDKSGLFYPLDSFGYEGDGDLSNTPIFVDGIPLVKKKLHHLAEMVSQRVEELDYEQRKRLHLAAVWVNNFTNAIARRGLEELSTHNIDPTLLHKLMETTLYKVKNSLPEDSQTGPAIRGDENTITKHLELMTNTENIELYKKLSLLINPDLNLD